LRGGRNRKGRGLFVFQSSLTKTSLKKKEASIKRVSVGEEGTDLAVMESLFHTGGSWYINYL